MRVVHATRRFPLRAAAAVLLGHVALAAFFRPSFAVASAVAFLLVVALLAALPPARLRGGSVVLLGAASVFVCTAVEVLDLLRSIDALLPAGSSSPGPLARLGFALFHGAVRAAVVVVVALPAVALLGELDAPPDDAPTT
ncbi:MAG: hypothetical protein ACF8XB_08415 [Planctomycetota bacterium JB042]